MRCMRQVKKRFLRYKMIQSPQTLITLTCYIQKAPVIQITKKKSAGVHSLSLKDCSFSNAVMSKLNPESVILAVISILIDSVQNLKLRLLCAFHRNNFIENCLLDACDRIEACRLAWRKVASMVIDVIADLLTFISTHALIVLSFIASATDMVID